VRVEDLRCFSRAEALYWQAVDSGLISHSEANALNWLGAAARATSVNGDAVRVFVGIVRRRLWKHITHEQEERARRALVRYREKDPRRFREAPGAHLPPMLTEEMASTRATGREPEEDLWRSRPIARGGRSAMVSTRETLLAMPMFREGLLPAGCRSPEERLDTSPFHSPMRGGAHTDAPGRNCRLPGEAIPISGGERADFRGKEGRARIPE
jgi:hypothetical protein